MSHLARELMRGVVVGTGKRLDEVSQRFAALLTRLFTSRDLQESKARLEEAQRVAHVGYWEWNLDTDRVTWSDETYRIYGLMPQKVPIDLPTIREMIHPDDRESVFRKAEEAILGGVRPDAEHRIVRPSGDVRTVHSQGDLKRDASGRLYQMFGTVQDITDRKRTEEALRQSQFYLSEGQRLAHMGSWASNDLGIRWSDDLSIYWSDEVYNIYGLDPQNGAPNLKQYLAAIHPDDRASMAETIRVMHEQRCGCDVTKRIVRPDGEVRYVRCVGVPVFEDGVFKAFHGTTIDVTEQELLARELRREQAYLAEAQNLTHTGSWACNLVTRQVFHSSDENARLYGFDPSQGAIPFERFYNSIHTEDEPALRAKLEGAIHARTDYDVEFRICRPDGTIRFLRGIGHQNLSGEVGDYVGITTDITERKRTEEERERLRQLEADLAHINRVHMMGELAAALAHEIKQPIAAATINAKTGLRWLQREPPEVEEACESLSRILKDVSRAADIVDRNRALYRRETQKRELVELNEVIREMSTLLYDKANQQSISIRTELDANLLPITADRVQVQQVLMNLMLNGIEAMKDTSGQLTVTSKKTEDGQLLVSVSDSGIGLPVEDTERIFDAFFTTKPQGTGMGLSISRRIIESHGGRLWATRNSGRGATFQFTVPIEAKASSTSAG
jgi:PAS domain S-box-containing protein